MTTSYNAQQVIVTWGSQVLTDGVPETGENITVARTTESGSLVSNLGGDAVLLLRNDRTGTLTITLFSHSEANTYLSEALTRQERTGRAVAKPLMVKDYNGNELFTSDTAVVATMPESGFAGDAVPTRSWTLLLPNLQMTHGGGTEVIPETF